MLKKSVLFFTILGIFQIFSLHIAVQHFSMSWEQARGLIAFVSGLLGIGLVGALFAKEYPSKYLIGVFGFMLLSTAGSYAFRFGQSDMSLGGVLDTTAATLPLGAAFMVLRRGEPDAPVWRIAVSWILIELIISEAADVPLGATTEGAIAISLIFLVAGILAYAVTAVGRKSPVPSQA